MRGRDLGMIFQEPLTRLNPLMRISEHFSETLKTHDKSISKDRDRTAVAGGAAGDGHPADAVPRLPARVLRRHAPAADDRADAGAAAAVRGGRRADHRARRAGRGADHPDPPRPARQLPHRAAADHPQPRHHRRGLRPGGGDVRRRDRRDRRRARGVLATQAPLHARAAALDDLAADDRSQLHRGRAAGPGRAAVRLPLPPALPGRHEGLRHPAPGRARARRVAAVPQCWAADFKDGLAADVPESERAPLEREEISVADEA